MKKSLNEINKTYLVGSIFVFDYDISLMVSDVLIIKEILMDCSVFTNLILHLAPINIQAAESIFKPKRFPDAIAVMLVLLYDFGMSTASSTECSINSSCC